MGVNSVGANSPWGETSIISTWSAPWTRCTKARLQCFGLTMHPQKIPASSSISSILGVHSFAFTVQKNTHFIWRVISTYPSQKATQTFFLDASLYVRSENVNLILNCKWLPGVGCPVHGKTQKNPHSWKNTKMATKGMSRPVVPLLRHVINVSIWALVFALVQSP